MLRTLNSVKIHLKGKNRTPSLIYFLMAVLEFEVCFRFRDSHFLLPVHSFLPFLAPLEDQESRVFLLQLHYLVPALKELMEFQDLQELQSPLEFREFHLPGK